MGSRKVGGPWVDRRYEGPEILERLLSRAGSTLDARAAIERMAAALAEGKEPPLVFPGLFPKEPRFGGPDDALRTYGNLFGAWDLLESGVDPAELLAPRPPAPPEPEEEPPPPRAPLPTRGSVAGDRIPPDVIDGTWQALLEMPPRERTRRQDRYQNVQSDLAEWARTAGPLSPVGQETLEMLCFELYEMADRAFGDRLGRVLFAELEQKPAADGDQPQALAYVRESLDEAVDEDTDPLPRAERVAVEDLARRVLSALTRAVQA